MLLLKNINIKFIVNAVKGMNNLGRLKSTGAYT
jgi:hypothetical protein